MLITQLIYTTMRIIYKGMTKYSNKVCDNLKKQKTCTLKYHSRKQISEKMTHSTVAVAKEVLLYLH